MTLGKEELQTSPEPSSKEKPTIDLAKIIIACHDKKPIFAGQPDSELTNLISVKDENGLAYWLHFNSFIKYQLRKIIQSADSDTALSDELVKNVHLILTKHLKDLEDKKKLTTYASSDFSTDEYMQLSQVYDSVRTKQKINALGAQDIEPILNAKNRRLRELGRSGQLTPIWCADYASQATARKLAKAIASLDVGGRKQYLYYHFNGNHTIGFDVERDKSVVYKIFCFESAADPKHMEALDLLYKELAKKDLKFEIKSCQSQLQKDEFNCSVYNLAVLSELGKYAHAFDYLPEQLEEEVSLKATKEIEIEKSITKKRKVKLENMDKITWVKLSDMPTKVIAMGQSYQAMEQALKKSKDFDLDPAVFIQLHKKKYHYDQSEEQSTKYINQRRKHIMDKLDVSIQPILKKSHSKFLERLPLLGLINEGKIPDFHKEITENKSMSLDEKMTYIEKLFFVITKKYTINGYFDSFEKIKEVPPHYLKSLLLLRNEYLCLLASKSRVEYEEFFKNRLNSSPLKYKLEEHCEKIPSVIGVCSLSSLFKQVFPNDFVAEYYQKQDSCGDLVLKNPLTGLLQENALLKPAEVMEKLKAFEKEYGDSVGLNLFVHSKIINFLDEARTKYNYHQHYTRLMKVKSGMNEATMLELFESKEYSVVPVAYIITEDNKLYFYHKENHPKLKAVPIDETNFQEMIKTATQQISKSGKKPEEELSLDNEQIKVVCFLDLETLNNFCTLASHAPYSPGELNNIMNLLVLREIYIQYLSKILSSDKVLAAKTWCSLKRLHLNFLDVVQKDVPISSTAREVIMKLDAAEKDYREHQNQRNLSFQKLSTALTSAAKGILEKGYSFFKPANIKDIVSAYFSKEPEEQCGEKGYRQENHEALGFKLSIFHAFSGVGDRWISYERTKPPVKEIDEFDWKFNLSIHKDDLSKAFPIIAEVANQMNLGLFKIMSQAQANSVQKIDSKTMIGRELVIYCNANPELDAEKWIDILVQIENCFKKAGIRTSTATCPASNRKLGKYVSYTHGAWTNVRMDVPFAEGIKETALEDDDLFVNYEYDEAAEAPRKKMASKKLN
ncbi:TPA: hypothetical protein ACF9EL_003109 [Legionella pneumophila]|nr:hypothetical protein [Legionella pneumophila]HEK3814290.1 hypothetical protein [Legionella pneumophila]HEK3817605.1 hypothetical protein [Legionella pneumophila]HEK3826908.1 hypothetical protein [Legionella pneumophila]HEK3833155.1 hypothetical protein [Legionella pneumophila]